MQHKSDNPTTKLSEAERRQKATLAVLQKNKQKPDTSVYRKQYDYRKENNIGRTISND